MAQFKPVMVQNKANLDTVEKAAGQYLVVIDANELYIDKTNAAGVVVREKVSQNTFFSTENETPVNAKEGDMWFVIEA